MDTHPISNEADVGLPPLSASRRAVWELYRIEFFDDGYPGRRRTGEMLSAHPIYGAYVITDYLASYRATGDVAFLDAAKRVAAAAIARMEPLEDALVFMYEPNAGLSSLPHRFYSGLTQTRYLGALGRLYRATRDDQYREATAAILRSLTVPVDRGGIARTTPTGGLVIEEYTHAAPDFTLNGWTTATLLIDEYARHADDADAHDLVAGSCHGIRDVLPLYDVPELANSRYRLGGAAQIKLVFSTAGAQLDDAEISIPGYGRYPIRADVQAQRWENRYVRGVEPDGTLPERLAVAEVFLSRVTWPTPNRLTARIRSDEAGTVRVRIGKGDYDPLTSRLRATTYDTLATIELEPGETTVDVAVPWTDAELVAYPTNFGKKLDGRNHNVYHFIHIDTLAKLAEQTGDDMFAYFADRWGRYVHRWPHMEVYTQADIALHRHGTQPEPEPAVEPDFPPVPAWRRWLGKLR